MSKRQALLVTLLGAAELSGNGMLADEIREQIGRDQRRAADWYARLEQAVSQSPQRHREAA